MAISILLFASFGAKSALLMGVVVVGLAVLFSEGEQFLEKLLMIFCVVVVALSTGPVEDAADVLSSARGLILIRILRGRWLEHVSLL